MYTWRLGELFRSLLRCLKCSTYRNSLSCRHSSVGTVPECSSEKKDTLVSIHDFLTSADAWNFHDWLIWKKLSVLPYLCHPYSIPCLFSARAFTELIGCSILWKSQRRMIPHLEWSPTWITWITWTPTWTQWGKRQGWRCRRRWREHQRATRQWSGGAQWQNVPNVTKVKVCIGFKLIWFCSFGLLLRHLGQVVTR